MSSNVIISRESLINHICNRLIPIGFQRDGDKFTFNGQCISQPAQQLIVNGAVQIIPEQYAPITLVCDCWGKGEIISEDGRVDDFELIHFEIQQEMHRHACGHSVYYGEYEVFDKLIKQYFGL